MMNEHRRKHERELIREMIHQNDVLMENSLLRDIEVKALEYFWSLPSNGGN